MQKKFFILFIGLTLTTQVTGQVQVLKEYDFDSGGYYLIGTRSISDSSALADRLQDFYTNDPAVLNEFKAEWIFTKTSPFYACGYHYHVDICKDGKSMESFSINLNCNMIATSQGYYFFESDRLEKFVDKVKHPFVKSDEFASLKEGRNYFKSIIKDKTLIMTPITDWTKFEGEFTFDYPCSNCFEDETKALITVEKEIRNNYPREDFELTGAGGSNTAIIVGVKCNKSLYDKFKLYKFGWQKWDDYKANLRTWWTIEK
jgi:hypothetical protein